MKNLIFLFILFIGACNSEAPEKNDFTIVGNEPEEVEKLAGYDSLLAVRLGADKYGMKKYVMAFLKAGPNRDQDSLSAANLQKGHMKNIQRMADEGKLIVAGPFLDDGELRGIYIFDIGTIEEAKALTETDPAIQAGRLVMELKPWYGSAALVETAKLHNKVAKGGI